MLPISVCLIGKNEEKNLDRCLSALAGHFSEIIYTDTGSTDDTLLVASQYPVQIFSFPWEDHFSKARNFSVSHASFDWILSIDCDEAVTFADSEAIKKHLEFPQVLGRIRRDNLLSKEGDSQMTEWISRLFHRRYYQFTGRIHEQLTPLASVKRQFSNLPISCLHYGYHQEHQDLQAKALRNIRLLEMDLAEFGTDPYVCFQLGQSYFMMEDYERALPFYEKAFSCDPDPAEEYAGMLVESYGYCLIYTKQYEKALPLENLMDFFGQSADFVFLLGLVYMNLLQFDRAVDAFANACKLSRFRVEGVNSYLACYNIGVIQECRGKLAEARTAYEKCGSYEPALLRLAELQTG